MTTPSAAVVTTTPSEVTAPQTPSAEVVTPTPSEVTAPQTSSASTTTLTHLGTTVCIIPSE